jgi:lipopolysaccharide biosynthesis glycosyltransferase
MGDISELWDIDMTDYYFGATTEPKRCRKDFVYANTGVVFMNLEKLRDGKDDEIIHALNTRKFHFPDQDVMNELCQGEFLVLDPAYGHTHVHCTPISKDPKIKHYAGLNNWTTSPKARKYAGMRWKDICSGPVVLFASNRPLYRAENIKAVWDAYPGEKRHTILRKNTSSDIESGDYDLIVTDEVLSKAKAPVICIGHGIPGGKTYGLDQPYPYYKKEHAELITWAITSSEDTIDIVAKSHGLPREKVLPIGMPRTDSYFHDHNDDKSEKRTYLYVPTFRDRHEHSDHRIDWDLVDRLLNDNEILIIKNHMVTGDKNLPEYKHIQQAPADVPSDRYLRTCDVVVTDYSSILFDGYILGKPGILFEKDWETYNRERGMYRPYPEGYASRHTTDEREFVKMCRDAAENGQGPEDIECMKQLCSACDGHSADRVVKLIEETLNGRV